MPFGQDVVCWNWCGILKHFCCFVSLCCFEMYFRAPSRYIKRLGDFNEIIAEQFVFLFNPIKKLSNKHFKIQHHFQNLTICSNDMIHTLAKYSSMFSTKEFKLSLATWNHVPEWIMKKKCNFYRTLKLRPSSQSYDSTLVQACTRMIARQIFETQPFANLRFIMLI